MPKVAFRVDSSNKIGTGHLARCLSLAEALLQKDFEIFFVSRLIKGNYNFLIDQNKFTLIELENLYQINLENIEESFKYQSWLEVSSDLDSKQTIDAIKRLNLDLLIVDNYSLDKKWEEKLSFYCKKIVVIDDLANRMHFCDLLIDQNFYKDYKIRYKNLLEKESKLLLGTKYSLLQENYNELRSNIQARKGKVKKIFCYISGADSLNLTLKITKIFIEIDDPEIELDIVSNKDIFEEIENTIKRSEFKTKIRHYTQLTTLANLMSNADLAIAAGGSSTLERCCLGLPSLVFTIADNQIESIKDLNFEGYLKWLGDARLMNDKEIMRGILNYKKISSSELYLMSKKCFSLVDGLGIDRVINQISNLLKN